MEKWFKMPFLPLTTHWFLLRISWFATRPHIETTPLLLPDASAIFIVRLFRWLGEWGNRLFVRALLTGGKGLRLMCPMVPICDCV